MKMKKISIAISISIFGFLAGNSLVLVSAEGTQSGAKLFDDHGCINCHGTDAKNPVSKIVPSLAGKPYDELYTNAKKILTGEGGSEESRLMHAALYSSANCDFPPTDEELRNISIWISQR